MCNKKTITLEHKIERTIEGNFDVALSVLVNEYPDDHISVKEVNGENTTFDIYTII